MDVSPLSPAPLSPPAATGEDVNESPLPLSTVILNQREADLLRVAAHRSGSVCSKELTALNDHEFDHVIAKLTGRLARLKKKHLRLALSQGCICHLLHVAYAGRGRDGQFTATLAELGYSRRRAYEYIEVWRAFRQFVDAVRFLECWCFESAKLIASAPEAAQAKAFERARRGEYISITLARQIISEAKQQSAASPLSPSTLARDTAATDRIAPLSSPQAPHPILDEPFHDELCDIDIHTVIRERPSVPDLKRVFTAALNHISRKLNLSAELS